MREAQLIKNDSNAEGMRALCQSTSTRGEEGYDRVRGSTVWRGMAPSLTRTRALERMNGRRVIMAMGRLGDEQLKLERKQEKRPVMMRRVKATVMSVTARVARGTWQAVWQTVNRAGESS
jgi:hypothetical protein